MEDKMKRSVLGAVIGDIVGSVYEWHNIKTKDFPLFSRRCKPTDDSFMTLAIADAILIWDKEGRPGYERLSQLTVEKMREYGRRYPRGGYGGHFVQWLADENLGPYNSCGNGAAMRVSAVGYAATSLEECLEMSRAVTAVTHDHPDGIMGAEATALQIFLLRKGATLEQLKEIEMEHYYPIDFTIPEIRPSYQWGSVCSNTCPQAFECVYEATDYEDAIRNAISIGGDSDTLAAIAGGVAGAAFGVPSVVAEQALLYLDQSLQNVIAAFDEKFIQ